MADETVVFTRGPARRPVQPVADPLMQWATGLQTADRRLYAGWLVPCQQSDTLDEALSVAGYEPVVIRHGNGNQIAHWAIEYANLFVLAEGVQSLVEMKHTSDRYGIAFGWKQLPDGRWQSQLRFRAHLQELLQVGYTEPLLISVKSTLTSDLITALTRQYAVLDAVDAIRREQGRPPMGAPFYACSIPIGPGEEVARGSAQTKAITPPVAKIPEVITRDYLKARWMRREWVGLIEGQLDATIAWSVAESCRISSDVAEEEAV